MRRTTVKCLRPYLRTSLLGRSRHLTSTLKSSVTSTTNPPSLKASLYTTTHVSSSFPPQDRGRGRWTLRGPTSLSQEWEAGAGSAQETTEAHQRPQLRRKASVRRDPDTSKPRHLETPTPRNPGTSKPRHLARTHSFPTDVARLPFSRDPTSRVMTGPQSE